MYVMSTLNLFVLLRCVDTKILSTNNLITQHCTALHNVAQRRTALHNRVAQRRKALHKMHIMLDKIKLPQPQSTCIPGMLRYTVL